jgi:N-methylhydantoinase B/oxoprolinase/acetone carboxylase alpha subunit
MSCVHHNHARAWFTLHTAMALISVTGAREACPVTEMRAITHNTQLMVNRITGLMKDLDKRVSDGVLVNLGGKCSVPVEAGDIFTLKTPGGGGWGRR